MLGHWTISGVSNEGRLAGSHRFPAGRRLRHSFQFGKEHRTTFRNGFQEIRSSSRTPQLVEGTKEVIDDNPICGDQGNWAWGGHSVEDCRRSFLVRRRIAGRGSESFSRRSLVFCSHSRSVEAVWACLGVVKETCAGQIRRGMGCRERTTLGWMFVLFVGRFERWAKFHSAVQLHAPDQIEFRPMRYGIKRGLLAGTLGTFIFIVGIVSRITDF